MIDPIAISLFGLDIHWYGLLWVAGYLLARHAAMRLGPPLIDREGYGARQIDDLCLWVLAGAFIGGRVGYVLIYGLDRFLAEPLWLLRINEGGMSFHGGLIGAMAVLLWQARRHGLELLRVGDVICLVSPLALACGRLGNFINGELWGKPTDLPWGMVFPAADGQARHPSQLYELFAEGLLLFALLWLLARSRPAPGVIAAAFLAGYGVARFLVEFVREPDAHIGHLAGGLSAGQWLSVPMIAAGAAVLAFALARSRAGAGD